MVLTYLIKGVFYNFFLLYIKMSEFNSIENTNLIYFQKSRDVILNRAKDYYKNDKERWREQAINKCRNLSDKEKYLRKEYIENRYHNISEEKKQRFKEYHKNFQKVKKSQYNDK